MSADGVWSLPLYGLTFNDNLPDETGCRYLCTDSGWRGGAAPRPSRSPKPNSSGEDRQPNFASGLVAVLAGDFWGPDAIARSRAEDKLNAIGRGPNDLFEVRCATALGEKFSMMELDAKPLVQPDKSPRDGIFSFQFASPDYRKYGVGQSIGGNVGLGSSTGGLDWVTGGGLNWVPGLDWGTVTSTGQLAFDNLPGTAPSDPVFLISCPTGTLINPTITNIGTGQRLRYNGTLTAGDTLRIDTSEFTRSVILNGGQDVRTRLTVAEWFQIPENTTCVVAFTADAANAAASLQGSAFIAYW